MMINDFEQYLKAIGKSPNTIISYVNNTKLMLEYVKKSDNEITFMDLINWMNSLNGSTSTVHTKVASVRSYFDFLVRADIVNDNPANRLETKKVRNKKKPDPESENAWVETVNKLVTYARGPRDKALIMLIATTGMRFAEATSITVEQFNSRRFTIIGKGDKPREIYINDQAKAYGDAYLKSRETDNPIMFVSYANGKLNLQNWNKGLKSTAKRAGIENYNEITAHLIRHIFATTASNRGVPVAHISRMLGHSNMSITERYIHTPKNTVVDVMSIMEY